MKKLSIFLLIPTLVAPYAAAKMGEATTPTGLKRILNKYPNLVIKFHTPGNKMSNKYLRLLKKASDKEEFKHIRFCKVNTEKYPDVGNKYKKAKGKGMDLVAIQGKKHKTLKNETPEELERTLLKHFG